MSVSVGGYVCWAVCYFHNIMYFYHYHYIYLFFTRIIPFTLPVLLLSAILTIVLLVLDRLSLSCIPREKVSVYDPSSDKRFIIESGEVVEPHEEDEV